MLHFFAERLAARWPGLFSASDFEPPGTRAALAAAVTFLAALASGPYLIAWLTRRARDPLKCPAPAVARLQQAKHARPTMGGVFIVGGLIAGGLLWGDLGNSYLVGALGLAAALCGLGAWDDWIKITTSRRGLSARSKLAAQTAIALAAAACVYQRHAPLPCGLELGLPLVGAIDLGWAFVPLAALVIVASSNAVNLADGLDGLAGGCLVCATGGMAVAAYAAGDAAWAAALGIPHVAGAGEMVVVAAATIGGLLAFLWFNCHPASVFMGNAGSLPLGGLLGFISVVARQEALLVVVGGVFVVEAASVIVQVASFRGLGRRVFLCAPLHHHFQLQGWSEEKIVVRFWIAATVCALAGLARWPLAASIAPPEHFTGLSQPAAGGLVPQEAASNGELPGANACLVDDLPRRAAHVARVPGT